MKQVLIKMEDDIYEQITKLAKEADMSVQSYMIAMSKDLMIYKPNYESIDNHTKEISALRNDIGLILRVIDKTNEAYNPDIQNIINILNIVLKTEKQFLKRFDNDRSRNRTLIKKTINKKLEDINNEKENKWNI